MVAKPRRAVSAYPDSTVYGIIGGNSPAVNRALTAWAEVLKVAEPNLTRAEWNYLAAAHDPVKMDVESVRVYGGDDLAHRVADMDTYLGLGHRFAPDEPESFVTCLVEKCEAMTWENVQYAVAAILFFEYAKDRIDPENDEWWTLPFRIQLLGQEEK